MFCGRCKATDVNIAHVRACYRTGGAPNRTEVSEPSGPRSRAAPTGSPGGVRGQVRWGRRGTRRRDNPWTWQPAVGQIESAIERGLDPDGFGGGMDADGGTRRLRALESELGFDAMLYMWRDDRDYDEFAHSPCRIHHMGPAQSRYFSCSSSTPLPNSVTSYGCSAR